MIINFPQNHLINQFIIYFFFHSLFHPLFLFFNLFTFFLPSIFFLSSLFFYFFSFILIIDWFMILSWLINHCLKFSFIILFFFHNLFLFFSLSIFFQLVFYARDRLLSLQSSIHFHSFNTFIFISELFFLGAPVFFFLFTYPVFLMVLARIIVHQPQWIFFVIFIFLCSFYYSLFLLSFHDIFSCFIRLIYHFSNFIHSLHSQAIALLIFSDFYPMQIFLFILEYLPLQKR